MRRLHTAVPLGVCRNSGSRVRFPTRTTRLMLAAIGTPFLERVFGHASPLPGRPRAPAPAPALLAPAAALVLAPVSPRRAEPAAPACSSAAESPCDAARRR